MARTRNLKPGFFHNEDLVELPLETRLLFAGLPCIADREGRIEDRPKRIKMMLFPADVFDVDSMLNDLQASNFILRYEVDGNKYIQIINFLKHQHPHKDEKESIIPPPCKHDASTIQAPCKHSSNPALNLKPSTLNLKPIEHVREKHHSDFEAWWKTYPKKVGKKPAKAIWKRIKPDSDVLIADTLTRTQNDRQWLAGYIPNPTTYLNQERWNDELQKPDNGQSDVERVIQQGRDYLRDAASDSAIVGGNGPALLAAVGETKRRH